MSGNTIDAAHKFCDVCGKPLRNEDGEGIRVLEVPIHAIEDLRKIDETIADELLLNDGRLAYHSECNHPIHQYLPKDSQRVVAGSVTGDDPADNLVSCPVCNIPVLKSADGCGRCGSDIEE